MRLASKSVRCRALQRRALDAGLRGQLCFTLPEALWLADHGFGDLVVAYPTADRAALRALAHGPHRGAITVMVDSGAHLDLVEAAGGGPVRVCLDVDAGWWPLGGRIRSASSARRCARPSRPRRWRPTQWRGPGIELVGLMAYEAHIAGVGDAPPGRRAYGAAVRAMQRASARELAARRSAVVAAVAAVAPLEFVNGGGTGSIRAHAAEAAVTEVTAGSGLYGPTLFDALPRLRTCARRPSSRCRSCASPRRASSTVLGGGYLASGAAGADRLPRPVLPAGLRLDRAEGAGEVQTPVRRPGRARPRTRRPGVVSSRQGGRAVRALRRACISSAARRSSTRCPPTVERGRRFL